MGSSTLELISAFNAFWETWAERTKGQDTINDIIDFFDQSITAIGTGDHEKGRNYKEVIQNFTDDFRELPTSIELHFFDKKGRLLGEGNGFVEANGRIDIASGESESLVFFLRFTTIFKLVDGQWKIIHNHVSVPYDDQNVGEAYPMDALKARNDKLENLVIERTEELRSEKERTEELLLNILPLEIAEELKQFGKSDARDFDKVSILFTDFKEFTQISQKLTAKELVAEINYCFKAFDEIVERYGIEKIKTIGDSYMAAGGLSDSATEAARRTVLAALDMTELIIERKAYNLTQGKEPFEMRAGVHTGAVVAGIVGLKKFQYDIWGDTVNTASRMESHGGVGRVNISESTYVVLKDDPMFEFEYRGMIPVKGKGEIKMYFVRKAH
jgi:class 3 adenylate cyclase/ketosteroid isomerase-like protein